MYTLGAGRIFIKSIIIVCLLNLMAWNASWAHRTGENEEKKDNDKIKNRSKRRAPVVLCRYFSVGNNQDGFSDDVIFFLPL